MTFNAAFTSAFPACPQAKHLKSACVVLFPLSTCPHSWHFLLVLRGSTATMCAALYSTLRRSSPHPVARIVLFIPALAATLPRRVQGAFGRARHLGDLQILDDDHASGIRESAADLMPPVASDVALAANRLGHSLAHDLAALAAFLAAGHTALIPLAAGFQSRHVGCSQNVARAGRHLPAVHVHPDGQSVVRWLRQLDLVADGGEPFAPVLARQMDAHDFRARVLVAARQPHPPDATQAKPAPFERCRTAGEIHPQFVIAVVELRLAVLRHLRIEVGCPRLRPAAECCAKRRVWQIGEPRRVLAESSGPLAPCEERHARLWPRSEPRLRRAVLPSPKLGAVRSHSPIPHEAASARHLEQRRELGGRRVDAEVCSTMGLHGFTPAGATAP